ncbi:MAG: polysaccharide pyruvyl transferase family protein [Lachnospiraceae bacterium]|nr:polysaccharide pyruvyl transferase family protein [Lachnospiraceae bacterium]
MEENRLLMYMHAGSGNHGCEAIVNSVCHMVKEKVTLLSYYGEEDEKYSLRDLCDIVSERRFEEHKLAHVLYYGYRKLSGDQESFIRYRYGDIMKGKTAPLAISIGGDNYCYDNMLSDLRLANSAFNRKGVRTVLLGCSIEPELLKREDIVADLMRYHTIIARESITYEALKDMVKEQDGRIEGRKRMPQILCYPDPAFTLQKKEMPLPEGFAGGNTVGINVSPMIQDNEKESGITMECYEALIQYIIENTGFQIALIPHVVWARNDDRKPIHTLFEKFKDTGRVVEIGDGTCEELKGYISRCRLFVGARTHATIAAYSSCVPTLVVGYSVKARGIARDLFGQEEHYVLPVQSLRNRDDLVKEFQWLSSREKEIREKLEKKMPDYRNRALETGKEVDRLWEEFTRQPKI